MRLCEGYLAAGWVGWQCTEKKNESLFALHKSVLYNIRHKNLRLGKREDANEREEEVIDEKT